MDDHGSSLHCHQLPYKCVQVGCRTQGYSGTYVIQSWEHAGHLALEINVCVISAVQCTGGFSWSWRDCSMCIVQLLQTVSLRQICILWASAIWRRFVDSSRPELRCSSFKLSSSTLWIYYIKYIWGKETTFSGMRKVLSSEVLLYALCRSELQWVSELAQLVFDMKGQ